ncbi:hypothetical protein ADIS_4848 [Lunatimonas lonarensis]|uniref:Outer membrane protein beta-barrel domain-containing protein n=1 Tax=Lunatimonas lonarensis TaxID=1232681 RepID=R7ZKY6_9BACT|nr:hypothetical protein [Lunatimonas lonarensis]EON74737.1 hypothetical protein ADIS_4848 [Lunatimonas lonarensis]
MKRLLILVLFFSWSSATMAQYKGQFRAQYGNDIGFERVLFGMNFSAEYFFVDKISFSPNVSILFPATGKASNLHLDARYYFTEEKAQWYGLLGFGNFRRRYEFNPEVAFRNWQTLNVGGGLLYKLIDELGVNGELKFQPQNNGELIVKIGLTYFIN